MYGGPATIMLASFHQEGRNEAGEPGILVPIRLPASAMERLKQNVRKELAGAHVDDVETAADETNSNMHGGGVLAKL